ncbi:hypothetical protein NF27_KG00050 [Candidatus Jidaibacter acanthamoeba]|uniref:Uncharacterized protein n=1 Tax=Candidatus Jidaibacter acanthamoebae TaxID=86105 RepID=A0A0C1MQ13_9RICK|nr:hypothetical protein NF27_KG00050 [Candidatus Jidaibacter acanthamoeba]
MYKCVNGHAYMHVSVKAHICRNVLMVIHININMQNFINLAIKKVGRHKNVKA